jgi:CHRD domain
MRWRSLISVVLVAGLVPALALASPSRTKLYKAFLTASSVVPKPGPVGGKGVARFTVTGRRLCWKLTVSGIGRPVAAHLHSSGAVTNGPVLVLLGKRFRPVGCTTMTVDAAAFLDGCAACGDVYVDVHTKWFPRGAIRGALEAGR